jgi:hypothetical protein
VWYLVGMIISTTERIFLSTGRDIWSREGQLELSAETVPVRKKDIHTAVHVLSGLEATDLAAFITYKQDKPKRTIGKSIGYLVTEVESNGSGLIVPGQLFEDHPEDWVNPRILSAWDALATQDCTPRNTFALPHLSHYLEALRQQELLQAQPAAR